MDYSLEEHNIRELQYQELSEWLLSIDIRGDHVNFIIKYLFEEYFYSIEDIMAIIPNNPYALPKKIGPANKKKIIQALIDENLLPLSSRAAKSIQPMEE